MKKVMEGVVIDTNEDNCIVYVQDYMDSTHMTHYILPLVAKLGDRVRITCEVVKMKLF